MVEKDEQFWRNIKNLLVWLLSRDIPGKAMLLQTDICMAGTGVKNMRFRSLKIISEIPF